MAIAIRQIATGTATLANTTSLSITLSTPVLDTGKTFVVATYRQGSAASPATSLVATELVAADTIRFSVATASATTHTIQWALVEAWEGIAVQRGLASLGGTSETIALPSTVDTASSFLLNSYLCGATTWEGAAFAGWRLDSGGASLTLRASGSVSRSVAWQVVTIEGASVERGEFTPTSTANTAMSVQPTNFVADRTLPLISWTAPNHTQLAPRLLRGRFGTSSPPPLNINRSVAGASFTLFWESVALPADFTVRDAITAASGTATATTATIASVEASRCVCLATGLNNTAGLTSYTTTNDFSVASFQVDLTSSEQVRSQRNGSISSSASATVQVVQFPAPVPQPTPPQPHVLTPFTPIAYQPNNIGSVNRIESILNPPTLTQLGTASLSQCGSFVPISYRLSGIGQVNGVANHAHSVSYIGTGIRQEARLSEISMPISYSTAKTDPVSNAIGLPLNPAYYEPAIAATGQAASFTPLTFQPNTFGSVSRTSELLLPVFYSNLGSGTTTQENLAFAPLQYFAVGLREVNPDVITLESFTATGYTQAITGLSNVLPSLVQPASYFALGLGQQYSAIASNQNEYASIASRQMTSLLSTNIPLGYPPTALTLTYFSLSFTGVAMATIALLQAPVISVFGRAVSRGSTNALMSGSQDAKIELGRREVN